MKLAKKLFLILTTFVAVICCIQLILMDLPCQWIRHGHLNIFPKCNKKEVNINGVGNTSNIYEDEKEKRKNFEDEESKKLNNIDEKSGESLLEEEKSSPKLLLIIYNPFWKNSVDICTL